MLRSGFLLLALALLVPFLAASPVRAGMDEPSLIAAWEEQMAMDGGTLLLEKIEEGRYLFETDRFPYSGEIHILNTDIFQDVYEYGENYAMGIVELELTDLPDDFFMKHSTSYYNWDRNNTLYYDLKNDQWLSESAWAATWTDTVYYQDSLFCGLDTGALTWIIVLLLLIPFLIFLIRKSSRQMKTAMEAQDKALKGQEVAIELTRQALELQRQSNDLLTEIRDLLENRTTYPTE